MADLTISIKDFRRLVAPVMPCAEKDRMLPVLNTVRIESRGEYLTALATDRYRLAMQRIKAPTDSTWPAWEATIPLASVRAILALFKPSRRDADPVVTLSISDDGFKVRVSGDNALLDMYEAQVSYPLETGEYPKVRKLLQAAIAAEDVGGSFAINPGILAGCLPVAASAVFKVGDPSKPVLITDGEDFIAAIVTRRSSAESFPSLDGWSELLADEPPAKSSRRRKGAAA